MLQPLFGFDRWGGEREKETDTYKGEEGRGGRERKRERGGETYVFSVCQGCVWDEARMSLRDTDTSLSLSLPRSPR